MITAAYFVVAQIGLRYATVGESISPVWPPTGLALAALLVVGREYWPAVLAGAFLANATTDIPWLAAVLIGGGNAGEAYVATTLMRGRSNVAEPATIQRLVWIAAPLGALVSAGTGVMALAVTGALPATPGPSAALGLWWAGDLLGALTVAPLILAWTAPAPQFVTRRALIELGAITLACVVVAELLVGRLFPPAFLPATDFPFLLFPLVIAAAVRAGPRGATVATIAVALVAIDSAAAGGGPFALRNVPGTAVALLLYIGVLAVTGLVLAALAAQRRRAEHDLHDSHERLRAVFDGSPLAIYTLGPEGVVLSWNPAAERLYGWTAAEVVGQSLPTAPESEQVVLRGQALGGRASTGLEVTRRRKDGSAITISLSLAPLFDGGRKVTGVIAVAADLTELRRLEAQYRQTQKVEAVGRLAGGVAHDFNNTLNAILSLTNLLERDLPADSPSRADAEQIRRAAQRGAGLTRQLLAFSRRQELQLRPVDVNGLVRDTERLLRSVVGEVTVLDLSLASDAAVVRADPGQLEQVLMNLVINASDAMPRGGVVTIETAHAELDGRHVDGHVPVVPGPYVLVAVSDTGIGMDEATRTRLFEPFFTTKPAGTGLGLATVYGIVKQSGGYIWAFSEPGRGSTFKIYLPRWREAASAVSAP